MSRTDLGPTTLAASLRRMAGDGSVEWVCEPMQTRVLLDVADMLDENAKLHRDVVETSLMLGGAWKHCAKLRELVRTLHYCTSSGECDGCPANSDGTARLMPDDICDTMLDRMRELGVEVNE